MKYVEAFFPKFSSTLATMAGVDTNRLRDAIQQMIPVPVAFEPGTDMASGGAHLSPEAREGGLLSHHSQRSRMMRRGRRRGRRRLLRREEQG